MTAEPAPAHPARYAEPTLKEIEEAEALLFLAATKKVLRTQEHIWDLRLELDVSYNVHNQRIYHVHATTRTGENITGTKGHYVHPANGTPENAALVIARDARSAAQRRKKTSERAAEKTADEHPRESA